MKLTKTGDISDFTPNSDVDVLYDLAPTSPVRSLLDIGGIAVDLETLFGRAVDLAEKDHLHPALAPHIMASQQVIYVRT